MPNLAVLPIWKKDASAGERLSELAYYAMTKPERFNRFVICYEEVLPNGNMKFRTLQHGCKLADQIGLFEIGKNESLKDSER